MMSDEITKKIFESYSNFNSIANPLIILLILNILAYIGKFVGDWILKNRESVIHKSNIITTRRIDIQENLYRSLDSLSLLTIENQDFLNRIIVVEIYMNQNKIYLDKKLFKQSNKILDYYKSIIYDYRKRNYEDELIMFDEYVQIFNK